MLGPEPPVQTQLPRQPWLPASLLRGRQIGVPARSLTERKVLERSNIVSRKDCSASTRVSRSAGAPTWSGYRMCALPSHQASLYGVPDRGRIAIGAHADLLLFDPATVGISAPRRVNDLPGGGPRTPRDPIGVHGVFVNGVRVFDGKDYVRLGKGPGHVRSRRPATSS
jgi:hypothetical protein